MTAGEYAKLARMLYAAARGIKPPADSTDPEKDTHMLIAYHIEQAAKIANHAAEEKARKEPL